MQHFDLIAQQGHTARTAIVAVVAVFEGINAAQPEHPVIVAGQARDGEDGIEEAAEAIDKGLANALLNCWIAEGSKQ